MKWKYLKKKFRYNPKRAFLFLFLFFFLTSFTIGYAFLTKELSIEGSSRLVGATWDIHFENIQVKSGSVTPTTAASITNPTTVTFGVQLDNPGDFYEFNIDVVNDGTFNAMIDSYSFLPVLTAEQQEYLEYTVTYSDGVPLAVYQELDAGTQETLKIRFGYIDGIDASLYPLTDQELTIEVEIVYVQADDNAIVRGSPLYNILADMAVMDNIASTYVTNSNGIQFGARSSDTNGKGIYLRAGTENDVYPIYYYRGAVNDNHVLFANYCWRIIRTTDTGGIKLIYDGVPSNEQCNNTGVNTHLSTTSTAFNTNYDSPADVGYMYGTRYGTSNADGDGWYYAPDVTYENGTYTLVAKDTYSVEKKTNGQLRYLTYQHYTCGSSSSTTCTSVRYVYWFSFNYVYYITLSNGKKVEDVLSEMFSNTNDSNIKGVIDTWYQNNMTSYTNKLEDTIYCNDRSITESSGWNPNGGDIQSIPYFSSYYRFNNPSLVCANKNDSFTVNESTTGNGKLTYPIGLLTSDELILAGVERGTSSTFYLNTSTSYWSSTPHLYTNQSRSFYFFSGGTLDQTYMAVDNGVRPVVSLKHTIQLIDGDGTTNNPYIIA